MSEAERRARGNRFPALRQVKRHRRLRRALHPIYHRDMDFPLDWGGFGIAGRRDYSETRRDTYGERWNNVQLHALVTQVNVLDVSKINRNLLGHFRAARFDVEGDSERSRGEWNAELDIWIENLDRLV